MFDDLDGKQLGNYKLIKELGRGTFGSVYLSRHMLLDKRPLVAVKVLHANLRSQAEYDLFFREARLLDKLTHPHILPVLDAGQYEGYPFFVVAYAPGGSLRDRLVQQNGVPIALEEALPWLDQIGRALQFAHDHNIVHRDLKPENILFNARGEAMLADFSIATEMPHTRNAYQMGTPPYMAPEQFLGTLSKRSDQYALACIAYELLTGQRPFPGTDFYAVGYMHVHEQPLPLTQINPRIPESVERVVLKALSKRREDRFSDLHAFIHALKVASGTQSKAPVMVPRQPLTSQNVSRLSLAWSTKTGGRICATPVVTESAVYVGSYDHFLYAFDPVWGKPYWSVKTGDFIASAPVVVEDTIYVGSADHHLYALDATNGSLRWTYKTKGYITSSPIFSSGLIYVSSWDYHLYALDVGTGQQRWVAHAGNALSSSAVIMNGIVYVGARDDKLYAFDAATGIPRWTFTTKGIITSSPAAANGIVYAGSWDCCLYALDALTGKLLWSVATQGSISSSPVVVNGIVYVGSDDHVLYAFNAANGKKLWSVVTGGAISACPVVTEHGIIFVGAGDGKLYALDANNGHVLWLGVVGAPINSTPTVVDDMVYVGADNGKLYAFHQAGERRMNT